VWRRGLFSLGLAGLGLASGWVQAQAPGGYQAPASFTRTYHGADGSVLSMRQQGSQVVGFSQDLPGFRSWVFVGQVSGQTLVGNYVTLPRGGNTTQGALSFTWSASGTQLQRVGSGDVGTTSWLAKLPSSFSFPQGGEARFQSTSSSDMDGAYRGSDGSRSWVRQTTGGQVFWYAERFHQAGGTRPLTATVGVGMVGAQGQLSGQWWDLPSQTEELRHGTIVGARINGARNFAQSLLAAAPGVQPRSATYRADYAIDIDRLALELNQRLQPWSVGHGWAIAQDGQVVRSGSAGLRRLSSQANGFAPALPYTTGTLSETASTSKTVTLLAVLHALRLRGLSVDSPVAPHLPLHWTRGPGMDTVTFRQILSHGTMPTPSAGLFYPSGCSVDPYGCLQDAVAGGMSREPGYHNIHYTLMRFVLPMLRNPLGTTLVCANESNKQLSNECFSSSFRGYIREMLSRAGVDADFKYVFGPGENGAYRYVFDTLFTAEIAPSVAASEDDYLFAGSGGLKMKPSEFARFLSQVERGGIVTAADLALAKAIGFGGDSAPPIGPDGVGPLWTRVGGAGGLAARLMVFPGTEVFVSANTSGVPNHPGLQQILVDAWTESLVGVPQ
jgi:hypothetical protein